MTPKSGRRIAWTSFLLGIAVSIAGNVGHAASDGMRPGEWVGAAFWPTALMLSIEILTRVRWQPETRWKLAKVVGLTVVATGAAILSYRHLAGLLTYWGEDAWNAHIGPLVVDGMMLLAATALLSISKEGTAHAPASATADSAVDSDAGADAAAADSAADQVLGLRPGSAAEETATTHRPPASQPTVVGRVTNVRDTANGIEYDWSHADQAAMADQDYLDQLDPPTDAELAERKASKAPESSKLHVVKSVSKGDSESAAQQAFIQSGGKLKPQDLMSQYGMSRSTAYRRISEWSSSAGTGERRIER